MKLQCPWGAKYAFDITPDMVQNPVRFICPQCGADSSDFVNELVRREFGQASPAGTSVTPPPADQPPAHPPRSGGRPGRIAPANFSRSQASRPTGGSARFKILPETSRRAGH